MNTMSESRLASVVIVSPSGRLRDGLRVVLRDSTGVQIVGESDDIQSVLRLLPDRGANVLLLDIELGDSAWALMARVRRDWPQVRVILLVHDHHQQRLAEYAGADGVLMAGSPAEEFKRMFRRVLQGERRLVAEDVNR